VHQGEREGGRSMTYAGRMARTHPSRATLEEAILVECIEACFDCAQACTACADACLGEESPKELARCIRLDLDCADLCEATGKVLSRQTAFEPQLAREALRACAEACRLCAEECEKHASEMNMEHCRVCAEACRRCEGSCNSALSAASA
jgi:hypothetical protein